jgi:uncharacterized membrane protein
MVVNRSPEECYRFWKNLENLPQFMRYLESVRVIDEKRSHWVAKLPKGGTLEWDSEITSDIPNSLLAWRSVEHAQVQNSGSVSFEPAPGGRGTIIRVRMQYEPPGGAVSSLAAKLMHGHPKSHVREDLRRFKQVMEAGEIPTTQGQPSGRRSLFARPFRPQTEIEGRRREIHEG